MSKILNDLQTALRLLNAEKATERKTNLEKIRVELKQPEVLAAVDSNTDNQSSGVTWKTIFRHIREYIIKESYRKDNQSARQTQNKNTCSLLFRDIIQIANRRGPRVPCKDVLKHISTFINDSSNLKTFGADYTNVLIKEILSIQHYKWSLDPNIIKGLLDRYCVLVKKPPKFLEKSLLSKAVYYLIVTASALGCLNAPEFFVFFRDVLGSVKNEKPSKHHENLLLALNAFSQTVVNDARIQLCHLGELLIDPLLHLLRNKPSDILKDTILTFLRMQLMLHHPKGATTVELGSYAYEQDAWLIHLKKIFHEVVVLLEQTGSRNKLSSCKEFTAKSELISLAVEVCHVVFQASDASSASSIEITCPSSSYPSKKRKVNLSFEVIMEPLQKPSASLETIPWLQLLCALLNKYPETISVNDVPSLLDQLLQLYTNCRMNEVKAMVLKGCLMVAKSFCFWRRNMDLSEESSFNDSWKQIWELAIRTVCINQCHNEGHHLLAYMLTQRLVNPEMEFFSLYRPGSSNQPSLASLYTLATYFKDFKLASIAVNEQSVFWKGGKEMLNRHQILCWFFGQNDDLLNDQSTPSLKHLDLEITPLAAKIICALALQNIDLKNITAPDDDQDMSVSVWNWIFKAEEMVCQSDFSGKSHKEQCNGKQKTTLVDGSEKIISSIWNETMEILIRGSGNLLEEVASMQNSSIEFSLTLISLMMHLIQDMSSHKAIMENDPIIRNVIAHVEKLFDILIQKMKTLESSEQKQILSAFRSLKFMYSSLIEDAHSFERNPASWLKEAVPQSLLDFIGNFLKNKVVQTKSGPSDDFSPLGFGINNIQNDDDETSDDLSHTSEELNSGSTPEEFSQVHTQGIGISSCSLLSEDELVVLEAAKAATSINQWLACCSKPGEHVFQKSLLHLVAKMNFAVVLDLQLSFQIIKGILNNPSGLGDHEITTTLNCIRNILNSNYKVDTNSKNYEVTAECLGVIAAIIPHAFTSTGFKEHRHAIFHMIKTLWDSVNNEHTTVPEKLKLALLQLVATFVKNDPEKIDWDHTDQEQATETIPHILLSSLKDSYHTVRIYAASHIDSLFASLSPNHSKSAPEKLFALLYANTVQGLRFEAKQTAEANADEKINRQLVLVTALKTTATATRFCEKHVLFAFFQVIKQFNVPKKLIQKVIRKLSEVLHYPSELVFIESHLLYMIYHWLNQHYTLQDFPFTLMKCTTFTEFCRQYRDMLFPFVFDHCNMDMIEAFSRELNVETKDLVQQFLPWLYARIIPWFATLNMGIFEAKHVKKQQQARKCYEILEKLLTPEFVQNSLGHLLDEVVIHLLEMLIEDENDQRLTGIKCVFPTPNLPSFHQKFITITFNYLVKECSVEKDKNLVNLLATKQDGLQKILFSLRVQLSKCHYPHDKIRVILRYHFMADYLLPELNAGVGQSWLFVMKEFLFVALQQLTVITPEEEEVGSLALDLLSRSCLETLKYFREELGDMLAEITSCLLTIVLGEFSSLQNKAVELLETLLIDNLHLMQDAASMLVPFPDIPVLKKIIDAQNNLMDVGGSFSQEKEMQHFIWTASRSTNDTSRIESLKHLLHLLRTKKDGLLALITQLQEKVMLTEDIGNNTIHQLISMLIELSVSSNVQVCQQASTCLGEIGPIDLSTLALPRKKPVTPDSHDMSNVTKNPYFETYRTMLHLLKDYLFDKNVDVVNTANNTLKKLLGCSLMQDFRFKCPENKRLYLYLYPFWISSSSSDSSATRIPMNPDLGLLDNKHFWIPGTINHADWVINLVSMLIESGAVKNPVLQKLKPMCEIRVDFSEQVLPHLVYDALLSNTPAHVSLISHHINGFFCEFSEAQKTIESGSQSKLVFSKASVQTMLNVVHYVRLLSKYRNNALNGWEKMFWLKNLNYLKVAEAAHFCSASFASLLYVELWCDVEFRSQILMDDESSHDSMQTDETVRDVDFENTLQKSVLSHLDDDRLQEIHDQLLKACHMIGDSDSIHGCMAISMGSKNSQIQLYETQRQWNKLLFEYDMHNCKTPNSEAVLVNVLRKCGLNHVLKGFLQGVSLSQKDQSPEFLEAQCESAWRLGLWNMDSFDQSEQQSAGFNQILCSCLNAATKMEEKPFYELLSVGRKNVAEKLTAGSLESAHEVYQAMLRFQLLNSVEEYLSYKKGNTALQDLLSKWKTQSQLPCFSFDFWEPYLCLQSAILTHEQTMHMDNTLLNGFKDCLDTIVSVAIQEKEVEVAEKTLQKLCTLTSENSNKMMCLKLDEAKVYWLRKDELTAKQCLQSLILKLDKKKDASERMSLLHAQALSLFGKWQAETHSESYKTVMEQFFEKAVNLMSPLSSVDKSHLWDAHFQIAQYAESQYKNLKAYINEDADSNTNFVKDELVALERRCSILNEEEKRTLRLLKRQHEIDQKKMKEILECCNNLCEKAVENYLLCLKGTDEHDISVFNLIALWFQESNSQFVIRKLQEYVRQLSTYKFLPLIYQLAARMDASKENEPFQIILGKLLCSIAADHPYHVLPIIFALYNADKDQSSSGEERCSQEASRKMEPKQKAAAKLISKLKSSNKGNGKRMLKILDQMELLCNEYISLAYLPVSQNGAGNSRRVNKIAPKHSIFNVKELTDVPVLSEEIPVDRSGRYENIVYVRGFKNQIELCGGINVPKIVYCEGSDGKQRKQLVKGRDDIRQDAVMQQVFSLMNKLLKKNTETSKSKLVVRTYKVVPMSRRSGLIQWCEGTQPFAKYLIGSDLQSGAHHYYYPDDLLASECRKTLHDARNKSKQERYKIFLKICKKFHPVFRYFFLENFPDPVVWMERRLMYIKSVATSSIVGYVLGLGDRHVQNILIDTNTAEMIHIDLGIAFDQGHLLPTPETIPFRLTRDVVDGMGVFGVEGTFRRCCEKTMEVMRNSQDALLTILEVLLYDPLYAWSLSPQQAMFLQEGKKRSGLISGDDEDQDCVEAANKRAPRVLMRLRQKLQGVESGVPLSISGQVNYLIQQAQDPANLAHVFSGWQPYI